jgi:hypothetical protein
VQKYVVLYYTTVRNIIMKKQTYKKYTYNACSMLKSKISSLRNVIDD